jgi:hypothetical protein
MGEREVKGEGWTPRLQRERAGGGERACGAGGGGQAFGLDEVNAPAARVGVDRPSAWNEVDPSGMRWTAFARDRERAFGARWACSRESGEAGAPFPGTAGPPDRAEGASTFIPAKPVHHIPAQPGSRKSGGAGPPSPAAGGSRPRPRSDRLSIVRRIRAAPACSGWVHFISVLTAVEAKPAAPVLASLAASTAAPRTAVGLAMARKQARPKPKALHDVIPSWLVRLQGIGLSFADAAAA